MQTTRGVTHTPFRELVVDGAHLFVSKTPADYEQTRQVLAGNGLRALTFSEADAFASKSPILRNIAAGGFFSNSPSRETLNWEDGALYGETHLDAGISSRVGYIVGVKIETVEEAAKNAHRVASPSK